MTGPSPSRRPALDGEKPFKTELYGNAELLNLGVADPHRIDVIRVP